MTCPKHNDPLKVYCKTCSEIICRDCTISKQHNRHEFELISECYPKHYRQIQDELGLLEDKLAIVDKAVTSLVAREREVVEQGEEVKKQICTHAQKLIDRIRQSKRELLKKLDTTVNEKKHLLVKQREQAERVHSQLKNCQETVKQSLEEWSQVQIMIEKQKMLEQMKTISQHVEPAVFQPIEESNTKFISSNARNGIGKIISRRYGRATFNIKPYKPNTLTTATSHPPVTRWLSFLTSSLSHLL